MITVYGIKNCDTVKKACHWLSENNIHFAFHDLRKDGVSQSRLTQWTARVDWQILLNRRGTTWRKLPEQAKASLNKTSAIKLMAEQPTLIKRPVIEHNSELVVGFSQDTYSAQFKQRH